MDLIDRQQAIDALQKEINKAKPPFDDVIGSIRCGVRLARNIIEDLPSAQPVATDINAGDTISRQQAIDAIFGEPLYKSGMKKRDVDVVVPAIYKKIKSLPSAQPERKTGYWIPVTNGRGGHECNRCHDYAPSYQNGDEYLANYCPNCGADMKGGTT